MQIHREPSCFPSPAHTEQALSLQQDRDTAGTGQTVTAKGPRAGSSQTSVVSLASHHSGSFCNPPGDILQTKLVPFTPNSSGGTFFWPSPTEPPHLTCLQLHPFPVSLQTRVCSTQWILATADPSVPLAASFSSLV